MVINLDESVNETWLNSAKSATNCLRNIETRIASTDSCYIKYDLLEPSCEQVFGYELRLGTHNENEDSNYFRYTGIFFFEDAFSELIKNAEEVKITFYLMKREGTYLGDENDEASDIFNNNILIKGHNYSTYVELFNNWDTQGSKEFKFNTGCPYMVSAYKEFNEAISEELTECTITLNSGILKEFEKHGVKGFQLYCHNNMNGKWSIDRNCLVEISRFKDYYNDTILSEDSIVVKYSKLYPDEYAHIGNLNFHRFFFFENNLAKLMEQAEELEVTFNLLWFLPTKEGDCNLNINNNYLSDDEKQGCVQLVGHTFNNLEELKLFDIKNDIFEDDAKLKILVYEDFKKAIDEGHTSYTFKLNRANIDILKEQKVKGFRLGLVNNGVGYIRTSNFCEIKITKYRDDLEFLYDYNSTENWISSSQAILVGKNEMNDVDHAAFYFFNDELYNALHNRIIENITVRFYIEGEIDEPIYHMCCHNYEDLDDISVNYVPRKNTLCSFKVKNNITGYKDIILSRTQINMLKEAKGLCFYSKDASTMTKHKDFVSVYISYFNTEDGHAQTREFSPISMNTFIRETDATYENFLVGKSIDNYLYHPYMFLGDNFYTFMSSLTDDDIVSIKIKITADNIRRIDNIYSTNEAVNLEVYTHNVPFLQDNYNTYKYKNLLLNTTIRSAEYIEIDLDPIQIDLMRETYGFGALLDNNNSFIVIKDFKVSITYIS